MFQHGTRSKYLPQRLHERALESMNDPDLLGLRQEVAALDARLTELYGRVDVGAGRNAWLEVKAKWRALVAARESRDADRLVAAFQDLDTAITLGASEFDAWSEIREVIQDRRRLVESERRRLVEAQLMMPADQVLGLTTALLSAVRTEVAGMDGGLSALGRIQDTFLKLTGAVARPNGV